MSIKPTHLQSPKELRKMRRQPEILRKENMDYQGENYGHTENLSVDILANQLTEFNQQIKNKNGYFQEDDENMSTQSLRIEKMKNRYGSPPLSASRIKKKKKKKRKKSKKIRNPFGERKNNNNNVHNSSEILVSTLTNELNKKNKRINYSQNALAPEFSPARSESAYSVADSVAALTKHLEEANQDVQSIRSDGQPHPRSEAAFSVADSVAEITSKLNSLNGLQPKQFNPLRSPSENSYGNSFYAESVYSLADTYADSLCSSSNYGSPSISGASVGPRRRSRRKKVRKQRTKRRKRKEKLFTLFDKVPVFRTKKLTTLLLPPVVKTNIRDLFFDPLV